MLTGAHTHPLTVMTAVTINSSLPVIWREAADPEIYEQARIGRVFNCRRPERYPCAVIEAETEEHVIQAVRWAKELACRVSIRSGGHSWAAWSVRDNSILIDLGKMKHISLDGETNIASVSPSTTGDMLNSYLAKRGLMFCGGHCPDVGLGGFLLQGGMGWNCRASTSIIQQSRSHYGKSASLTRVTELGMGVRASCCTRCSDC